MLPLAHAAARACARSAATCSSVLCASSQNSVFRRMLRTGAQWHQRAGVAWKHSLYPRLDVRNPRESNSPCHQRPRVSAELSLHACCLLCSTAPCAAWTSVSWRLTRRKDRSALTAGATPFIEHMITKADGRADTTDAARRFSLACMVLKLEPEKAAIAAAALAQPSAATTWTRKPRRSVPRRPVNVLRVDGPAATADRALVLLCGGEEHEGGVALVAAAMREYMMYLAMVRLRCAAGVGVSRDTP